MEKLTRQGWRAASFAVIDGLEAEAATPFAIGNRVWLSRFGDGEKSFFALSAPDRAVFRGKLRIKGGKFGAAGAVYANVDGSPTANQVTAEETVVDIELSGHQVLVLQRVGSRPIGKYTETLAAEKSVADTCDWIDSFEFLNGARRLAAIAADPADTGELENELRCLRSYASYISSRRRVSARRLWDMGDFWHRHLLLDRDMPKTDLLSRYPVIFAIGSNARQAYFPTEKFSDRIVKKVIGNQTIIAFFPGKNSEKELLREFFRRLDKRYYFIGVITEPWAVDAGIHSKIFKRKLPARP